jgi:hypothetical protein
LTDVESKEACLFTNNKHASLKSRWAWNQGGGSNFGSGWYNRGYYCGAIDNTDKTSTNIKENNILEFTEENKSMKNDNNIILGFTKKKQDCNKANEFASINNTKSTAHVKLI